MNIQHAFNDVWNGLKNQNFNRSSIQMSGGCLYRNGNQKCAAGHLIPDDLYDVSMETYAFFTDNWFANVSPEMTASLQEYLKEKYEVEDFNWDGFVEIISELQHIHDNSFFPQVMREKLEEWAANNKLIVPKD